MEFPAASPHVVAVGGTRLKLGAGSTWAGETVWNGDGAGGGGCSTIFPAPTWQLSLSDWASVGCAGERAVADVSADADPYTGVAVADSTSPKCETSYTEGKTKHVLHWCTLGGTSLASPIIASVFALAGGAAASPTRPPPSTRKRWRPRLRCTRHQRVQRRMQPALQHLHRGLRLHRRTRVGAMHEAPDLPRRERLRRTIRSGYTRRNQRLRAGRRRTPGLPAAGRLGRQRPPGGGPSTDPISGEAPGGAQPDPGEDEGEEDLTPAEAGTISGLSLTPASWAAAAHHRLLEVAFAFSASASVHVHVTLSRSVAVHRRVRWHALHHSETIAARKGRNSARLTTGPLAPGSYRLTLTTAHGPARSVVIHVRG